MLGSRQWRIGKQKEEIGRDMPDDTPRAAPEWTRATDLARLQPSRPIAVKLHGKHIALFLHQGEVLACNNRCPHEGYPLVEGALDADCVPTCHWHRGN